MKSKRQKTQTYPRKGWTDADILKILLDHQLVQLRHHNVKQFVVVLLVLGRTNFFLCEESR